MSPAEAKVINFQYPDAPWQSESIGWQEWAIGQDGAESGEDRAANPNGENPTNENGGVGSEDNLTSRTQSGAEQHDHETVRQAYEEGRAKGRAEGLVQGRSEGEAAGRSDEFRRMAAERELEKRERTASAAELINGFYREQEQYLHEVEHEVAKLALAISARILRREAQMDRLFLTGAVRVALGQLSESTEVVLHVPEADLALWTDAMRLVPNLTNRPKVVPGEGMTLGECRLQTEMGVVDLGVRAQLAEIERGFFDGTNKREDANRKSAVENAEEVDQASHGRATAQSNPAMTAKSPSRNSSEHERGFQSEHAIEGQYLDEPANARVVEALS